MSDEALDSPSRPARPAAQHAYAHIKERLLDGRFAGGTLLSENDLAQRLGVSRTPVRHAFALLQAEGLLELYPKRGALVVPVLALGGRRRARGPAAVRAALRARARAPPARRSSRACARRSPPRSARSPAAPASPEADRRFHRALVAAVGQPRSCCASTTLLRDRHQRIAATTVARDPVPCRALHRRAPRDRGGDRARRRRGGRRADARPPADRARAARGGASEPRHAPLRPPPGRAAAHLSRRA